MISTLATILIISATQIDSVDNHWLTLAVSKVTGRAMLLPPARIVTYDNGYFRIIQSADGVEILYAQSEHWIIYRVDANNTTGGNYAGNRQ